MKRTIARWTGYAATGMALSVFPLINFNAIWFEVLLGILTAIVTLLLGGATGGNNTGL